MKGLVEFISESRFNRDAILKLIEKMAKKYDKKFIKDAVQEIQDDIDEQDKYIEDNPESNIWQFIQDVADEMKISVEDLWEEMGGSYDFAAALTNVY